MSLVGFKAQNHQQQVKKRGASDTVDERITPDAIFKPLHERYSFTLDAAASAANTKCAKFFDLTSDGLKQCWFGETVWCNPPYSNLKDWVAKAFSEWMCGGTIVMLLPANRTEQKWWQTYIEPHRDRGLGLTTENLPRRINFGTPSNPTGKYNSSAPFGCVLITFEQVRTKA